MDGKNWKSPLTMGIVPLFRPILRVYVLAEMRVTSKPSSAKKPLS